MRGPGADLRRQFPDVRLFDTPLRCLDDVLGAVTLTRAGAGLVQTYHFVAQPDVSSGALVEVLPALRGATRPFYLLYPPNRYLATAVRAFVDFLLLPQA